MLPFTDSSTCRCESSFPVEKEHILSSTNNNHTSKSPLRQKNSIYSNGTNSKHKYNYYQRCMPTTNCLYIRSAIKQNTFCCQTSQVKKSIIHATLRNKYICIQQKNKIQNKENSDINVNYL